MMRHRWAILLFLMAALTASSAPAQQAPPNLEETFETFKVGQAPVTEAPGRFKTAVANPPLDLGKVDRASEDAANKTNVLKHLSATTNVITRLANGQMTPASGPVQASIDIRPMVGAHGIYFWPEESKSKDSVQIWFRADGAITATTEGNQGVRLGSGNWQAGHWYRVSVRLNLDKADGTKSRFDVEVTDLNTKKSLGRLTGLDALGAPTQVSGGQLLSTLKDGKLEASFDNWKIGTGKAAEPAAPAPAVAAPAAISPIATPQAAPRPTATEASLDESFEADALQNWQVSTQNSAAECRVVAGGQLSDRSLQIDKPDTTGSFKLARRVAVKEGEFFLATMDIQSLRVGPFAEYWMEANWLDSGGEPIGPAQRMAFDDGLAVSSSFGGAFKTPQTLGQWKRTRHVLEAPPGARQLELAICLASGSQQLRVDNVRIEPAGTTRPALPQVPVYQREIRSAGMASLVLDMLVPGFQYEVEAKTDAADTTLMGISSSWQDLAGNWSDPTPLRITRREASTLWFELDVPFRAVQVRLDLHSNDAVKFGALQTASKQYRNWRQIAIRTVQTLPATDAMFQNHQQSVGEDVELTRPAGSVQLDAFERQAIRARAGLRPTEDAQVVQVNGGMAIRIGQKDYPPLISAALRDRGFDFYSELGKRGLNIFRVENVRGGAAIGGQWKSENEFDFSGLDERIEAVLSQNPDAYVVLVTDGLYPPTWWGDAHPDELMQDQDGQVCSSFDTMLYTRMWGKWNNGELGRIHAAKYKDNRWLTNQGAAESTLYVPSPASRAYREVMKKYLAALRQHVERQPYAGAVIGYHLWWGEDTQWNWPRNPVRKDIGTDDRKLSARLVDYSPAMAQYFREFLKSRYGNVAALRKAWNDPQVTFETAAIPKVAQRQPADSAESGGRRLLLDPATERAVLDYHECYYRVVGDLLNEFGTAVKAAAPRKILVVAYFQDTMRELGHDLVLAGTGMDISGGPSYEAREVGQGGLTPHLADSYRLHNKIEFTEVDYRVFPCLYRYYRSNQVFETPRKSISVLRREMGRQICTGEGAWTLDMGYGWFAHPLMAETLGQIRSVWEKSLRRDRTSPAQMAVFLGQRKFENSTVGYWHWYNLYLGERVRVMLPHAGLPIDVYRLNDLSAVADRYKVFVFPDAFALSDEQVQQIEKLKRNGNVLVFGPAAGYAQDQGLSDQNVSRMVGMSLRRDDGLPLTAQITDSQHAITGDARGFIGSDEEYHSKLNFPMFEVTDPAAVALGRFVGAANGRTAIAVKDCGNWKSVYIGAMGLWPAELLRGVGRFAGLHVYSSDGDVTYFARGLLAVHASSNGEKVIELPEEMYVTSLWDGKSLGRVRSIRRHMQTGDNALYSLSKDKE